MRFLSYQILMIIEIDAVKKMYREKFDSIGNWVEGNSALVYGVDIGLVR